MNRNDPVLTDDIRKADTWFELPAAGYVLADAKKAKHFRFVPNQACTFGVTNATSGRRILVRVEQPASGGFAVTLDGAITAGTVTISTTASAVTMFELIWDEFLKTWYAYAYGGGGNFADTGLTNLASVAIDVSLDPATDLTYTIGSGSKHWQTTFTREVKGGATLYLYAQTTDDTLLYLGATGSGFLQAGGDFTLWYGSALYFDADRHVGDAGTTGFDKTAKTGSGGNFNCKYEGTVAWRLESATTMYLNDCNLKLGVSTGTKIGTTTAQKLGFWGATPVVQQAAISDASGGAVVDDQARAAINSALAVLRTLGIIAP